MQGFPMLNGNKWNELNWDWERSLLNLRQFVSKRNNNIFISQKNNNQLVKDDNNKFTDDELDKIETNLKQLMIDVVVEIGGTNDSILLTDIENLITFEKTLAEVTSNNS